MLALVLVGLSTTFDTVDQSIIIERLDNMGWHLRDCPPVVLLILQVR